MIVLVEMHAMTGLGSGNSPTPIPNIAYVVSDEGSISRSATEPPRPNRLELMKIRCYQLEERKHKKEIIYVLCCEREFIEGQSEVNHLLPPTYSLFVASFAPVGT